MPDGKLFEQIEQDVIEYLERICDRNNSKMPIGLVPKYTAIERRIIKIQSAILRHIESDYQVPIEWVEEYNELIVEHIKLKSKKD